MVCAYKKSSRYFQVVLSSLILLNCFGYICRFVLKLNGIIDFISLLYFFLFPLKKSYLKSIVVFRDMYRLSVRCFGYDCTQSIKFKPIKIISPFVILKTCFVLSVVVSHLKAVCLLRITKHFNCTTFTQVYYLKANLANTIKSLDTSHCLRMSYYVIFLGAQVRSNEFHIK